MINMNFELKVSSTIDIPKHLAKINDADFWKFAACEWWRLMYPYIPFNTGALMSTTNIHVKDKMTEKEAIEKALSSNNFTSEGNCTGVITFRAPYASAVYTSNRNFRQDEHKLASSRWDEAAAPTQGPKLIEALQKYVDSGRLKL